MVCTDETADQLESLYRDHASAVLRFARRRVPAADAEDVTAEVFRITARQLQGRQVTDLRRAWFIAVARTVIVDRWRQEQRNRRRQGALETAALARRDGGPPSEVIDRLFDALARLEESQRRVLVLKYVERATTREIAETLGRSPAAVDSLLARARRALHEAFCALEP